jgi:hypothetical protein
MPKRSRMDTCTHHWVIGIPSGPTSVGVCKNCGKHGEFKNSFDSTPWMGAGQKKRKKK